MALVERPDTRVAEAATASGSYRCAACGHAVTVIRELPECELCSGHDWVPAPWSPFSKLR